MWCSLIFFPYQIHRSRKRVYRRGSVQGILQEIVCVSNTFSSLILNRACCLQLWEVSCWLWCGMSMQVCSIEVLIWGCCFICSGECSGFMTMGFQKCISTLQAPPCLLRLHLHHVCVVKSFSSDLEKKTCSSLASSTEWKLPNHCWRSVAWQARTHTQAHKLAMSFSVICTSFLSAER